ncbi:MAG: radical SAM protein [Verrucomicrobia bacterium]|nr:radical SAM protein [Verrucomicrobiota bacterium]
MNDHLQISEIYLSIQGESSFVGLPCVFVRLTGCDLRCAYCDSAFAFTEGARMPLEEILGRIETFRCPLVEITGGEPLLQKGVFPLMTRLCDSGKTTLLETSGAHDISKADSRIIRIMDWKCPSSGECDRNLMSNLDCLGANDEVKFVIGTRADFEWARDRVRRHALNQKTRCVLFSPTFKTAETPGQTRGHAGLDPKTLVEWILEERLPVRFQPQIHKFVWPPTHRGV